MMTNKEFEMKQEKTSVRGMSRRNNDISVCA